MKSRLKKKYMKAVNAIDVPLYQPRKMMHAYNIWVKWTKNYFRKLYNGEIMMFDATKLVL